MRITYHEEDGRMVLNYQEDVEPVLKYAHEKRAAEGEFERMGEFKHVMRVPEVVMLEIRNKYGWDYMNKDHWPHVKKILTGPEYAAYKTTKKRI